MAVLSIRWLSPGCHIKLGKTISTAGVEVHRPGSTERFFTMSSHAAYEGLCKQSLPYCSKRKSSGLFGMKSKKPLPDLVGHPVLDRSRNTEV
jgi:hypothetical protein